MPRQARKNDIKLPETPTNRSNLPAHAVFSEEWTDGWKREENKLDGERISDRERLKILKNVVCHFS